MRTNITLSFQRNKNSMNGCINDLINEISTDNMMKTLKVFSKLHRYSGSEHG